MCLLFRRCNGAGHHHHARGRELPPEERRRRGTTGAAAGGPRSVLVQGEPRRKKERGQDINSTRCSPDCSARVGRSVRAGWTDACNHAHVHATRQ